MKNDVSIIWPSEVRKPPMGIVRPSLRWSLEFGAKTVGPPAREEIESLGLTWTADGDIWACEGHARADTTWKELDDCEMCKVATITQRMMNQKESLPEEPLSGIPAPWLK